MESKMRCALTWPQSSIQVFWSRSRRKPNGYRFQNIYNQYDISFPDLPEVLEEYISTDKKNIWRNWGVKENELPYVIDFCPPDGYFEGGSKLLDIQK